jgi:hypothetical protein
MTLVQPAEGVFATLPKGVKCEISKESPLSFVLPEANSAYLAPARVHEDWLACRCPFRQNPRPTNREGEL